MRKSNLILRHQWSYKKASSISLWKKKGDTDLYRVSTYTQRALIKFVMDISEQGYNCFVPPTITDISHESITKQHLNPYTTAIRKLIKWDHILKYCCRHSGCIFSIVTFHAFLCWLLIAFRCEFCWSAGHGLIKNLSVTFAKDFPHFPVSSIKDTNPMAHANARAKKKNEKKNWKFLNSCHYSHRKWMQTFQFQSHLIIARRTFGFTNDMHSPKNVSSNCHWKSRHFKEQDLLLLRILLTKKNA